MPRGMPRTTLLAAPEQLEAAKSFSSLAATASVVTIAVMSANLLVAAGLR